MRLTHLDAEGGLHMVDVGNKAHTDRIAVAKAQVHMQPETLRLIADGDIPKGDVLTTAQLAGIMAAKQTPNLIPLCHPLLLAKVDVAFEIDQDASRIEITATVRAHGTTGVEMQEIERPRNSLIRALLAIRS